MYQVDNNHKKVGIVTVYRNINFGSNLQSYALQKTLNKLGFTAENICLDNSYKKETCIQQLLNKIKYLVKLIIWKGIRLENAKREHCFNKYVRNNLKISDYTCEEIEYLENNGKTPYEYYICGSDQIWAPNQFRPHFFLSFTKRKKSKIAYAPSIGIPIIPETLKNNYKNLITDFEHLSIRENDGAKLIKEITGVNIPVVLDPTLLLNREEWLSHSKPRASKTQYILCYFLGDNEEHRKYVEEYSKATGYEIYVLPSDTQKIAWGNKMIYNAGPKEFINLLNNAYIMFTDSFHGTIFSINLHKEFYTFLRFKTDDPLNQNSRIYSILTETKLLNRIITYPDKGQITSKPIDWDETDRIIQGKREFSIDYLKKSIR